MKKFIAWFLIFVGGFFLLDGVLCIPVVLCADGMTLLQRILIVLFFVAMALGGGFLCGKGFRRLNALSPAADSEETTECAETPSECRGELSVPVRFVGTEIHIDSDAVIRQRAADPSVLQHEFRGILPLSEKEPVLKLYEDGVLTREYCLQTEGDEDFTGKFFLISVRVGMLGKPPTLVAQIDGFISDTSEERAMTVNDIGYRMEGHFLRRGPFANTHYEAVRGQDLPAKGLKYVGYTTPSNVRLIGVCSDCGKSFGFHGYGVYMASRCCLFRRWVGLLCRYRSH